MPNTKDFGIWPSTAVVVTYDQQRRRLNTAFAEIVNQILAIQFTFGLSAASETVQSDTKVSVANYDAARWSSV